MRTLHTYLSFLLSAILFFVQCSPKKYFAEDDKLLVGNVVTCDNASIDVAEPQAYIRQTPVRLVMGIALHARIYNCVDPQKADSIKIVNDKKLDAKNKQIKSKFLDKSYFLKDTIKKAKFSAQWYEENEPRPDTAAFWRKVAAKYEKKLAKHEAKGYEEKTKIFSFPLFLQKIGEEPVKYKPASTQKSVEQIVLYMKTKGFYDAKVTYEEKIKNKNVTVTYKIEAGDPIKINKIDYNIENDDTLKKYVLLDTAKCSFKTGDNLDIDVLSSERSRITANLKNNGYYRFSNDYINYLVDTINGNHLADITIDFLPVTLDNGRVAKHHRSFISNVKIYPNFDTKEALKNEEEYYSKMDTTILRPRNGGGAVVYFLSEEESSVKRFMIAKEVFVKKGDIYCEQNVNNTYRHLTAFNVYKLVNIEFEPSNHRDSLNCNIFLTNAPLQSFSTEIDGTNSSGNLGAQTSFTYRHKNIFHGAESLDLSFGLALESQTSFANEQRNFDLNTQEYSLETKLYFPRFLGPLALRRLTRDNTPKTYWSLGFNYRKRPDYTRSAITASYYYQWNIGKYSSNVVTPLRLSSIKISDTDSAFMAWLDRLYIKDSYQDHFILGSSYSFTFNNQGNGHRMHNYLKFNLSWAGNMLNAISKMTGATPNEHGDYTVPWLETNYAQFVKAEIDFRHYIKTVGTNTIVFRAYAGVGLPYGNSNAMPFTEQFFSGGANSLRAWQIRSVGPGSFVNTENNGLVSKYPNMTSDMKLEANLEYRFKIFWVVEGAWFVDAGNIWSINNDDRRSGGDFSFNRFYKEIAIGSGLGFRLDFDFFIFRTDFGLKLHDPSLQDGKRWVFQDDKQFLFRPKNWAFNLGIGYPF